jgi:hypothetical protein
MLAESGKHPAGKNLFTLLNAVVLGFGKPAGNLN